jgi:hypothetical protein
VTRRQTVILFWCAVFGVGAIYWLRAFKFSEIAVWVFGAVFPFASFLILAAYVFPDKE